MFLPEAIRRWYITAEDFDGETVDLTGDVAFVGTWDEADERARYLSDQYEKEHGFCLSEIMIESGGILWQGPGKYGGLNPVGQKVLTPEVREELGTMRICNQRLNLSRVS